jgi:hypothetical protein
MPQKNGTVETVETSLEIDEVLPLQEKGWVWQRIGWGLILAIMLAGGLGLFGEGLLSEKTATAGNSEVQYEQFFRYEVEMKVLVQSKDHISSISFPGQYLKNFRIVRFVPEPANNNSTNGTVKYNFLPSENNIVSIYMVTKGYGSIGGTMKVNEKDNFQLNHFIFP